MEVGEVGWRLESGSENIEVRYPSKGVEIGRQDVFSIPGTKGTRCEKGSHAVTRKEKV
jgi:hypothetical protein